MRKIDLACLIGLILTISISGITTFAGDCNNIRQEVLRFHVMANSDSEADQKIKLAVRDAVIEQTDILFEQVDNKQAAEKMAKEKLPQIEAVAKAELVRHGSTDSVKAELVNMYFNTRIYPEFTLPAGKYDAVRVTIGQGKGKNWWCVVFPSMCIGVAEDKMDGFTNAEKQIIQAKPVYEPRFAIIEFLEKFTAGGEPGEPVANRHTL
ncbi:MAG: stage II sporulation protein R [Oscillospiraceae bacterium]